MARLTIALAVVTVLCIAFVDVPVAHWVAAHDTQPNVWSAVLHVLEFPLGIEPWRYIGVAVLTTGVIATQLVWKRHANAWLFVAATHLVSRNVMLWTKTIFGRLRPSEWHGGPTFWQGGGSFPSGHVMIFASLVLPLAVMFPRARWLIAIPVYAMIARVMANAHFASDVVAGLAATCAITWGLCALIKPSQLRDSAR